jgi:XTP/dITP diphosphohydrolase
MNKTLLIATHNPGKIREMRSLLSPLPCSLITLNDIDIHFSVEEDGNTYVENAQKKASFYAAKSGLIAIADDSGLEVDALGGLPGIRSARFSDLPQATDADRRAYLLQLLQTHPRPWTARFRGVAAGCQPHSTPQLFEGSCEGEIIPFERGQQGFGYDPIFYLPELGLTMAELTMEQKNHLSHRARAIRSAIPYLTRLLSQPD